MSPPPPPVGAILLAAGLSRRFGHVGPKQLYPFAGQPLVRRLASVLAASRVAEVVVVLGHEAAAVGMALQGLPVSRVLNRAFAEGQATSVVAGLEAVGEVCRGALFVPCDQPFLTTEAVNSLLLAFEEGEASIVAPAFQGRRGAPTLFGRRFFPQLRALQGDTGGREVLRQHEGEVRRVEIADPRVLEDADTLEEMMVLERHGSPAP